MFHGIIIVLLAVAEDRATLGSDLSAVYGIGGKSDTMPHMGSLFFFVCLIV